MVKKIHNEAQNQYQEYTKVSLSKRHEVIAFFRLTKVYKSDKMRIVWSFPPTMPGMKARDFWSEYAKSQEEWEEKLGRPPASYMERQLGEWAEALL